ncbi:hypothetical protein C8R45DRAFT_979965 [Mycena sanguinolenta]|nr:hypothetical protein C8R45DRAFT_979965 [Mycena sanguinolenta]
MFNCLPKAWQRIIVAVQMLLVLVNYHQMSGCLGLVTSASVELDSSASGPRFLRTVGQDLISVIQILSVAVFYFFYLCFSSPTKAHI